jgi:hypothetical protein
MKMEQDDFDTISEIVSRYGFDEWSLVGFTPKREYTVYSYFRDSSVMPVFKIILIKMLKAVEEYLQKDRVHGKQTTYHVGEC